MNIYYTAKDIEELAAKGVQQLEIGPGITLTDFARETALQLNIALVDGRKKATAAAAAAAPSAPSSSADRYNKPKGCMHASSAQPATNIAAAVPGERSVQAMEGTDANTVSRLIDLMGKVIKRGG